MGLRRCFDFLGGFFIRCAYPTFKANMAVLIKFFIVLPLECSLEASRGISVGLRGYLALGVDREEYFQG